MATKIEVTPEQVSAASRSFVTPFELTGSRPRDVQLSAGGRFVYGFALLLFAAALVGGVVLSRVSANQTEQRNLLNRTGVVTTGEVTRLWRASDDAWASYRFDVAGVPYDGRTKMRSSRWRTLHVGSPLDVRYLPDRPTTNVLVGYERGGVPAFVPFLLAALMSMGGVLLIWNVNCQRRLLMEGRAAAAIVTGVVTHKTSHGGTQRSIKYAFQLLSGAMARGKSDASGKPPALGSVICVVYDPDRPRRSRRYPFPFVKTARL